MHRFNPPFFTAIHLLIGLLVSLCTAARAQGPVSGKVTWKGKPVANAVVRWPAGKAEARTDAQGRYSIGGPAALMASPLRAPAPGKRDFFLADGRRAGLGFPSSPWIRSFGRPEEASVPAPLRKPAGAAPMRLEVFARGYRDTAVQAPDGPATVDVALEKDLRRHLWIWGNETVTDAAERDKLFDFAAKKGIGTLYLDAQGPVRNNKAGVGDFLDAAKAKGLAVELLFGAPQWALPANHGTPVGLAQDVLAIYQAQKEKGGAYPTSVQFDVEPYSLPLWETDKPAVAGGLLDMYRKVVQVLQGAPVGVTACIPRWFDVHDLTRDGKTRLLSDWLADATDRLTLMDYVDHANGIIAGAEHEIAYADSIGKEVVVGVETMPDLDPESVSFAEEGEAAMEAALTATTARFGDKPSWFGIAVHHYETYPALKP